MTNQIISQHFLKRINEILKKKKQELFYANLSEGGASHHSYGNLGFRDADHYFVYPISSQLKINN